MNDNRIILFERKEECCGCEACMNICNQRAITMITDEEGFDYPYIDTDKCVKCTMCLKVCPIKTIREES